MKIDFENKGFTHGSFSIEGTDYNINYVSIPEGTKLYHGNNFEQGNNILVGDLKYFLINPDHAEDNQYGIMHEFETTIPLNLIRLDDKATQDYSNDDHSNLSVILTRLKTQSVWFKFDIVTFIKLGNLQLSEVGKEQCTNIKTKITAIDENGFTQLFQTIVSNLLEEEYKQQLVDAVNKIKNEIYIHLNKEQKNF